MLLNYFLLKPKTFWRPDDLFLIDTSTFMRHHHKLSSNLDSVGEEEALDFKSNYQ